MIDLRVHRDLCPAILGTSLGTRECPTVEADRERSGAHTGHIYVEERKRVRVWYAKYRAPVGNQVKKMLGPAWT